MLDNKKLGALRNKDNVAPVSHPPVNLPLLTQASEKDLGTFRQRRTGSALVPSSARCTLYMRSIDHKNKAKQRMQPMYQKTIEENGAKRKGSDDFTVDAILDKPATIEGASSSKEDTPEIMAAKTGMKAEDPSMDAKNGDGTLKSPVVAEELFLSIRMVVRN
ncbi:hypothetical protein Tco_1036693 [Tanacetum coccineum]